MNTNKEPDYILKFVPNKDLLKAVATVDASQLGGVETIDFSATEGATSASGVGTGLGAVMAGACAKVTNCVKLDSLLKTVADPGAAKKGYNKVTIKKL